MARPTATKSSPETTKPNGLELPKPIPEMERELYYLLGHLRGTNVATADRITELIITMEAAHRERITDLERGYANGEVSAANKGR